MLLLCRLVLPIIIVYRHLLNKNLLKHLYKKNVIFQKIVTRKKKQKKRG